jgi:hypothetical protein
MDYENENDKNRTMNVDIVDVNRGVAEFFIQLLIACIVDDNFQIKRQRDFALFIQVQNEDNFFKTMV